MNHIWMLTLGLALSACTIPVHDDSGKMDFGGEPGDLALTWRVGTAGCGEAGLSTVAVLLDGHEDRSFSCDASFGVVERLEPGIYDVTLVGRAASGHDRYGASLGSVEVHEGARSGPPTAVLGALPGDIVVTWYFGNARMCTANGVTDVEITLFDEEYVVDTTVVPCADGISVFPQVRADEYQVNVMGREIGGRAVFNGVGDAQLDMGDEVYVEVELEEL